MTPPIAVSPHAVGFDPGRAGFGTVPNDAALNLPGVNWTVEFWYRGFPRATGQVGFLGTSSGAAGWTVRSEATGLFTFRYGNGASQRTFPGTIAPFSPSVWQHYAWTKNGATCTTYSNAVPTGTLTVPAAETVAPNANALNLNRDVGGINYVGGQVAEIRIWDYARSAAELEAGFFTRMTGDEPGLVACWPLDEGTGSTGIDVVAGRNVTLSGHFWTSPPNPYVTEQPPHTGGSGGDGGDPEALDNALAGWLSQSDLTHPDSLPAVNYDLLGLIRAKLGIGEGALDVQIGDFRAWVEFAIGELEVGVAKIDDQTKPSPGVTPVPNDVILSQLLAAIAAHDATSVGAHQEIHDDLAGHDADQDQHMTYLGQVLSGHPEFSVLDPELPAWSITSDVNAHTDEGLVILQGDMNAHEEQTVDRINTNTDEEVSRVEGAINGHSDALSAIEVAAIATGTINVNQHTDEVATAINAHTTLETDAVVNTVNIHADANTAAISVAIVASEERLAEQAAVDRGAIEEHVTDEANRVIAAIPPAGGGDPADVIGPVNAHTTNEANRVIANNNAQTAILIAVQSALAALTLTVNTILEKVQDMVDQLASVASNVAAILAILQQQTGSGLAPVKVGETTFSGTTYWPQPADYYEVEVLEPGQQSGQQPIPNGLYFRFMGWCAPRVGGKYQFGTPLAFNSQRVPIGSIVPDGLLVFVKQGTTGRVSAFQYQ